MSAIRHSISLSSLIRRAARWVAVLALASGAAAAALPTSGAPELAHCDRHCLTTITEQYLAALVAHDPSKAPLDPRARITENGQVLSLKQGLWASALKNGVSRVLVADSALGQVGYLGTLQETGGIAEISLRLKVELGRIVEVETIVQRDERELILPLVESPDPLFQAELPAAQRRSRDEMIRIATSYFDGVRNSDSRGVSLAPDAVRNENGEQKQNDPENAKKPTIGQQFDMGFSKAVLPRDLRLIAVDESKGIVYVGVLIDYLGGVTKVTARDGRTLDVPAWIQRPNTWLCSEALAISGGLIRRLDAIYVRVPFGFQAGWPAPGGT